MPLTPELPATGSNQNVALAALACFALGFVVTWIARRPK